MALLGRCVRYFRLRTVLGSERKGLSVSTVTTFSATFGCFFFDFFRVTVGCVWLYEKPSGNRGGIFVVLLSLGVKSNACKPSRAGSDSSSKSSCSSSKSSSASFTSDSSKGSDFSVSATTSSISFVLSFSSFILTLVFYCAKLVQGESNTK